MHLSTAGTVPRQVPFKGSIPSGPLLVKGIVVIFFAVCLLGRPANSAAVSSARDAVISWSPPSNSRSVHYYEVTYTALESLLPNCTLNRSDTKRVALEPEITSVKLRDLRPFTLYAVKIWTRALLALPRRSYIFETKEAAGAGATKHCIVAPSTDRIWDRDSQWEPFTICSSRWSAYQSATHCHRGWAGLAVVVRGGLVKVFAQNGAGLSPHFASVNFTTAPSLPPQPTDLLASEVTQESVQVSWNAPYPPHGVLDQYRLRYWRDQDSSKATEIAVAHEECRRRRRFLARHCYTVNGLDHATVYHFKVRAMNVGTPFSPYSTEMKVTTMSSEPPQNLRTLDRTENSLKILWYTTNITRKEPTDYMVNASLVHSYNGELAQVWSPKSFVMNRSLDRQFHIKYLFPGSTYRICVQETTDDGVGETSCGNFSTRASVPVVREAPRVDAMDRNTVNVSLTAVEFQEGPLTAYYLLVVKKVHEVEAPIRLLNFSSAEDTGLGYYVAARFTPDEIGSRLRFVVGTGDVVGGFENPPLEAGAPYSFGLVAESNFLGDAIYGYRLTTPVIVGTTFVRSEYTNATSNTYWPLIAASSLGVLVLLAVATGLACYCRRKRTQRPHCRELSTSIILEERFPANVKQSVQKPEPEVASHSKRAEMNEYICTASSAAACATSVAATTDTTATAASRPSNPVAIKRFEEYVTKALADGSLLQEYTSLRSGKLHPTNIAEKTENKSKNRHERVLPCKWIDFVGSGNPRKYIAAQGPIQTTGCDFLSMIWQENVSKVVMLSGQDDQDEMTYWPESNQKYGAVAVTLKKKSLKADFVIRELELSVEDKTRSVVHFHYNAWPRHSVPPCTDSLESFITAVRSFRPSDAYPTLVHGRESIGRTGTFILIDSMISEAEADGEVDFVKQLHTMRHSRMNMVETAEQYIFSHKMLVVMICTRGRKLTVEEFLAQYQHLKAKHPVTGKTPISKEFEELGRKRPHPGAADYKGARDERNVCKNRTLKILAADIKRPLLSVKNDGKKTDYINAVFVDGYKKENAYLVTQMPLPETVDDFWEMVAGSGSITLVTLGPLVDE
ncbi:hypothetical protein V5799_029673, partial [Amblyomma americanum]